MLKLLYAGSPSPSAAVLLSLAKMGQQGGYTISAVLTNQAAPRGRSSRLVPTEVATAAESQNIPVITANHLDAKVRAAVAEYHPDLLVCFDYGRIFGPKFLALFPVGAINLHPSLLPCYRGPTPHIAPILNGDKETGLSIQHITQEMDAGNLIAIQKFTLPPDATSDFIMNFAKNNGATLLDSILQQAAAKGTLPVGTPQQGVPTFTSFVSKESSHLDFSVPVDLLERQVRAYFSSPIAWCASSSVGTIRIHAASALQDTALHQDAASTEYAPLLSHCQDAPGTISFFNKTLGIAVRAKGGFLLIHKLQRQGKAVLDAASFMNGARSFVGTTLS